MKSPIALHHHHDPLGASRFVVIRVGPYRLVWANDGWVPYSIRNGEGWHRRLRNGHVVYAFKAER